MRDWNWITDQVAIGSAPKPADIPAMRKQGVTDVLDLRGEPLAREKRADFYEGSGIRYHYLPMLDRDQPQPLGKYRRGVKIIERALKHGGKIIVHCRMGISRSSSMVYAYLRTHGFSKSMAWTFITAYRPQADKLYFDSAEKFVRES